MTTNRFSSILCNFQTHKWIHPTLPASKIILLKNGSACLQSITINTSKYHSLLYNLLMILGAFPIFWAYTVRKVVLWLNVKNKEYWILSRIIIKIHLKY